MLESLSVSSKWTFSVEYQVLFRSSISSFRHYKLVLCVRVKLVFRFHFLAFPEQLWPSVPRRLLLFCVLWTHWDLLIASFFSPILDPESELEMSFRPCSGQSPLSNTFKCWVARCIWAKSTSLLVVSYLHLLTFTLYKRSSSFLACRRLREDKRQWDRQEKIKYETKPRSPCRNKPEIENQCEVQTVSSRWTSLVLGQASKCSHDAHAHNQML